MSQPISPDDLDLLLAGYVLNDLDAAEAAELAAQLDDPAIAAEIASLQSVWEQANGVPAPVQPPAHLRSTLIARFEAAQTATEPTEPIAPVAAPVEPIAPPLPRWRSEWRQLPRWAKTAGLAAAATIAALATSNVWLWRSLQTQQARLPAPSSEPIALVLRPPAGTQLAAQVAIEVYPEQMTGRLKIDQLPPLAPGKVYVLWTVLAPDAPFTTDRKNAILTHVLTPTSTGDRVQELVLPKAFRDLDRVKAVAISIEDARAPQRHESPPILIQRL